MSFMTWVMHWFRPAEVSHMHTTRQSTTLTDLSPGMSVLNANLTALSEAVRRTGSSMADLQRSFRPPGQSYGRLISAVYLDRQQVWTEEQLTTPAERCKSCGRKNIRHKAICEGCGAPL